MKYFEYHVEKYILLINIFVKIDYTVLFLSLQGKVHLELKLNELITENGTVCQQLVVQ